ncbi:MAG: di-heme enzyme [Cellvibrio sp. 79]|nr:MAG: di-heme enzyme [Cellvibrio sp. 79]
MLVLLAGCYGDSQTKVNDTSAIVTEFNWNLPPQMALPVEPADNPMTEAKFQLGRHLFYDKRLSGGGTISCASCHEQNKAFADNQIRPLGGAGDLHPRNSQSLANSAWFASVTWGNPSLTTIEQQTMLPLFGVDPIEHGINETNHPAILQSILQDARYKPLFAQAYPNLQQIDWKQLVDSLATFVRGIISFRSAYDRYIAGDKSALSESAKRGMQLFNSERLECFHCHDGHLFTDSVRDRSMLVFETPFHNTGLYNIDGVGGYPAPNTGAHEVTGRAVEMGAFRAASLRNVAVTAPYMHDGSIATLADVVRTYAAGGRNIIEGENIGDGRRNPYKDSFIAGFEISEEEIADVIAFLNSLTDEQLLIDDRYGNPFE